MKIHNGFLVALITLGACGKSGDPSGQNSNPNSDIPVGGGVSVSNPRFIGRVDNTVTNPSFTWAGTAVETSFSGSQVTVNLTNSSESDDNYVDITVDNGTPTKQQVTNQPITVNIQSSGNHIVRVTKVTEDSYGDLVFNGFTYTGAPQPTITAPGRLIEFIGDSITNGYGIEGDNTGLPQYQSCVAEPNNENAAKSFASLTAAALKADASLVAYSGHGVIRNQPGASPPDLVPAMWTRTSPRDPNSTYSFATQADAVVINLGTNDFTQAGVENIPDLPTFTNAYEQLVANIRSKYPKAPVFLCVGPMLYDNVADNIPAYSDLRNALETIAASDTNSTVVDFGVQDTTVPTDYACEFHPNPATAQIMSEALQSAMLTKLSWK